MFISASETEGSCYLEFAFCSSCRPAPGGKTDLDIITHWSEDSLLISWEDFGSFYAEYSDILCCALLPNGETGFDCYCPNYYDRVKTSAVLSALRERETEKYLPLIPWLERAEADFEEFYILGV